MNHFSLHIEEIFFEAEKVLGNGVNVVSRIQSLGQANTILFSKEVCDKLRNEPEFKAVSLGKFEFKNVDEPVEVFALANDGLIVFGILRICSFDTSLTFFSKT